MAKYGTDYESGLRDIREAFNSLMRRINNLLSESSTGYEAKLFEDGIARIQSVRGAAAGCSGCHFELVTGDTAVEHDCGKDRRDGSL